MSDSPERLVGTVVDRRYTLTKLLGHGGFGAVFHAEDRDGPPCALKLIRLARATDRGDAALEASLMREHAHAGVVAYRETGRFAPSAQRFTYIAMELGQGSLYDHLQRSGPLAARELRVVVLDLLEVLSHLHARGVVHRDVKPGNLIRVGDRYKLCDFGAARTAESSIEDSSRRSGTPEYMAPEAFELDEGPPADMWSIGMLVHECATRELPFDVLGKDPLDIARIVRDAAPRIDASLPAPFDAIVRGCLVRDPARRWTAADIRAALERAPHATESFAPPKARRPAARRALVGALLVAALGIAAMASAEIARRPDQRGVIVERGEMNGKAVEGAKREETLERVANGRSAK